MKNPDEPSGKFWLCCFAVVIFLIAMDWIVYAIMFAMYGTLILASLAIVYGSCKNLFDR